MTAALALDTYQSLCRRSVVLEPLPDSPTPQSIFLAVFKVHTRGNAKVNMGTAERALLQKQEKEVA